MEIHAATARLLGRSHSSGRSIYTATRFFLDSACICASWEGWKVCQILCHPCAFSKQAKLYTVRHPGPWSHVVDPGAMQNNMFFPNKVAAKIHTFEVDFQSRHIIPNKGQWWLITCPLFLVGGGSFDGRATNVQSQYCWWFRNPKQQPGMYKTL